MGEHLLLVSVGNTRTRIAAVRQGQLEPSRVETNADTGALSGLIAEAARSGGDESDTPPVLFASVNRPVSDAVIGSLKSAGVSVLRFDPSGGEADGVLPIPIAHSLTDAGGVGPDRLLDALGAFARAKQACVVIDAGTAITVDFVDGEGTFHGGAIAPGVKMMLDAMHEKTAALPAIPMPIDPGLLPTTEANRPPFGRATRQAMVLGVLSAARGLAHLLIDRYAEYYEAYPRIIATGGDAPMLFENDDLVEHIVPDLTLVGMLEAYRRLEQLGDEDADRLAAHQ
ncbi:MAG: type III pantothenate kinase [Phycisphaerales bacterium]|nr:type III pantothenate kinase [Phycisphaerales bacterium]